MLERWNPTVKAFTVLICVILLSFEYLVSLNLLVLAVCLLLLMFCSRVSLKKIGVILLPACIAAFGLFVTGLYYARGGSTQTMDLSSLSAMPYSVRAALSQNLYTALQLATRLLAYAGLGILFALSTEGDFFIASLLHQCHLPPKFAYGILAAFHLMPGMAREYAQVRTAFAARSSPCWSTASAGRSPSPWPWSPRAFAGMRRVPIIRYHGCTGMTWPPRRSWWAAWCWECCF